MEWEYEMVARRHRRYFLNHLNERGEEGWEVVAATIPAAEDGTHVALLKRQTSAEAREVAAQRAEA